VLNALDRPDKAATGNRAIIVENKKFRRDEERDVVDEMF
jgi:hypothetical protein